MGWLDWLFGANDNTDNKYVDISDKEEFDKKIEQEKQEILYDFKVIDWCTEGKGVIDHSYGYSYGHNFYKIIDAVDILIKIQDSIYALYIDAEYAKYIYKEVNGRNDEVIVKKLGIIRDLCKGTKFDYIEDNFLLALIYGLENGDLKYIKYIKDNFRFGRNNEMKIDFTNDCSKCLSEEICSIKKERENAYNTLSGVDVNDNFSLKFACKHFNYKPYVARKELYEKTGN